MRIKITVPKEVTERLSKEQGSLADFGDALREFLKLPPGETLSIHWYTDVE